MAIMSDDVNVADKHGITVLMKVCQDGRSEAVQLLKEAGAKE